jgi:hypothetical protein
MTLIETDHFIEINITKQAAAKAGLSLSAYFEKLI